MIKNYLEVDISLSTSKGGRMIPWHRIRKSVFKEVERLLLEKGYTKEKAKKILRLYQK